MIGSKYPPDLYEQPNHLFHVLSILKVTSMQLRRYTLVRLILEDEGRILLLRQTRRNGGDRKSVV